MDSVLYVSSLCISLHTHSQERDDKLSRHKGQSTAPATRGTPTAGPMVTVSRDQKAASRGAAISKRGASAATNGGVPGDLRVSVSMSAHTVLIFGVWLEYLVVCFELYFQCCGMYLQVI